MMNISRRLDQILQKPDLIIKYNRPIVFFSDLHMGDGGPADNFAKNSVLFRKTLKHYIDDNFLIILVGDIWELWQFTKEEIALAYPEIYFPLLDRIQLAGNHDRELKYRESLLITGNENILVIHGHQGDWIND